MVMGINPPTSGNTFDAFQMLAEKTNGTSSNATTSNATTSTPTNHMVTVGKDGQLRYDPEFITAAVGDTVTYQFFPKNHTVTQSNFAEPCQPKADTSSDHTPGFDSGFMPVAANDATPHLFTITVNDTNPIWAYCRQVGHCGSGMVMGINPPTSGNTFDAFQMLAEKINGTSSASTPGAIGTDYSSTYGSSASTASAPGAMGTDYSSTYGSSASTASAPAATSTGYGSTYGSSASTVKGAVDDAAVGGSSINVSDLTRNTYIIIGLLCALLLGLIVLAMFTLFQRGGGYKAVPISTAAPGILPYSQKGPYSTPYSTADAEEYRD
jgi:plastocyanin